MNSAATIAAARFDISRRYDAAAPLPPLRHAAAIAASATPSVRLPLPMVE